MIQAIKRKVEGIEEKARRMESLVKTNPREIFIIWKFRWKSCHQFKSKSPRWKQLRWQVEIMESWRTTIPPSPLKPPLSIQVSDWVIRKAICKIDVDTPIFYPSILLLSGPKYLSLIYYELITAWPYRNIRNVIIFLLNWLPETWNFLYNFGIHQMCQKFIVLATINILCRSVAFLTTLNMEHWLAKLISAFVSPSSPNSTISHPTCPLALIDHPQGTRNSGPISEWPENESTLCTHILFKCADFQTRICLSFSTPQNGPLTIIKLDSISREDSICLQIWINLTIFIPKKPRPLFG